MAKDELRTLPLNQVHPSEVSLRKVKRDTEKYLELVDSIRVVGVLSPILVREVKDPEKGTKFWSLIDGLQRYTASIDAGKETIPAHIVTANEIEQLEYQIISNIHKIETRPTEYAAQMERLLLLNPLMTLEDQATRVGKSSEWVRKNLGLTKLSDDIKTLVDTSQINVTNAYQLAKLPIEEQANFVSQAMTMTPAQFIPTAAARAKELRDAKRQGRTANGQKEFIPAPFLQSLKDIKEELRTLQNARGLIHQFRITEVEEAYKMALSWVLHQDPINVESLRQQDQERKRLARVAREKKKAERDAKTQEEATLVAAGINVDDDDFGLDDSE